MYLFRRFIKPLLCAKPRARSLQCGERRREVHGGLWARVSQVAGRGRWAGRDPQDRVWSVPGPNLHLQDV